MASTSSRAHRILCVVLHAALTHLSTAICFGLLHSVSTTRFSSHQSTCREVCVCWSEDTFSFFLHFQTSIQDPFRCSVLSAPGLYNHSNLVGLVAVRTEEERRTLDSFFEKHHITKRYYEDFITSGSSYTSGLGAQLPLKLFGAAAGSL